MSRKSKVSSERSSLATFLQTYWHHAKNEIDLALFFVSLASFFFSRNYSLPPLVGLTTLILLLIHAFYKTWEYEHVQRMLLQDARPSYHRLNRIQQLILRALRTAEYKHITVLSHMSGWTVLMGNPGKDNTAFQELSELDAQEVAANLRHLEEKGVLAIESRIHDRDPNYTLAALGYDLIKQID